MADDLPGGQQAADMQPTSSATQMLVEQMRYERRSFSGILFLFFLILSGVAALFLHNYLDLRRVSSESERQRFETVGESAEALTQIRSQLDAVATGQKRIEMGRAAERAMVLVATRSSQLRPDQRLAAAVRLTQQHFLGRPLNDSSAELVAAEVDRAPDSPRALMLAALRDYNLPAIAIDDATERKYAQSLKNDPVYGGMDAVMLAGLDVRSAQLAENNWDWAKGCETIVAEIDQALDQGVRKLIDQFVADGDLDAAGLNLDYWRGQCLRKHGDPEAAELSFDRMLKIASDPRFPDENPFKFQAYHGKATVMTAILEMQNIPAPRRSGYMTEARYMLEYAGLLRRANGSIDSGSFGSTENIGFLLLKEDRPDRYIRVLEHTGPIDAQMSLTWNLVARLAAARGLQKSGLPPQGAPPEEVKSDVIDGLAANIARMRKALGMPALPPPRSVLNDPAFRAAMKDKYTPAALNEIVFQVHAKLARRSAASVSSPELKHLLGADHADALAEASACIAAKAECLTMKWPPKATPHAAEGAAAAKP